MGSRLFLPEGLASDTCTPPEVTTPPSKHSALLEVIDLAREREGALVDSLHADARTAIGTVERWAPKDHFAHRATWAAFQARRLEAVATGNPPTQPADNDTVFLERRDEAWETIWADLMRALDDTAAAVMRVSDEQLTALNNTYLHPITHVAHLYEERGDDASAERVQ